MFGQSRTALAEKNLADKPRSGGFLAGFFRRKAKPSRSRKAMSDTINVYIDADDDTPSRKKSSTRPKPAAKKAAPKKATPKRKPAAKKATPRKAAPKRKPAAKKAAPRKAAPACRAVEKRRAKRRRKQERERIGVEAFGSTKRRLGMSDHAEEPTNADALMDAVELADCLYSEHEEAPAQEGMADKEPTDAQVKKLNRINERLRELELLLGEKYRAGYSSRNDRGYVLRKYVGVNEKIETWGDPYIARRPVGIGGKTLERVFMKKHGLSWEDFAKESASIHELRSKIEKHNGTTTSAERKKQEAIVLKERQKEEREIAAKAKAEAAKLKKAADAKAKTAKTQEAKAEKAEKVAKVAKAKAKKEPTKTNKAAAVAAEKKAVVEEKKVEKIEKEVEKLEVKAEKAEAKAEAAEDENAALDKELLELAKMFS